MIFKNNLSESVSNLYAEFSQYKVNTKMEFCSHCKDKDDVKLITSKPLKELKAEDLSYYATCAISTMGGIGDFKYYLPRLIEIITFEMNKFNVDPEIIFNKIAYSNLLNWSFNELSAIKRYAKALWESQFEDHIVKSDNMFGIDSILCCIGQFDENITSYLDYWLNLNNDLSKRIFFDFLYLNLGPMIKKKKLFNSFWENSPENMMKTCLWLKNNTAKFNVESIFNLIPENDQYRLVQVSNDLNVYKSDIV